VVCYYLSEEHFSFLVFNFLQLNVPLKNYNDSHSIVFNYIPEIGAVVYCTLRLCIAALERRLLSADTADKKQSLNLI